MARESRGKSLSLDWYVVFSKPKTGGRPGYEQKEKSPVTFCTGSMYSGSWNRIGMAGFGTYTFPHKVEYEGTMDDGQFHGDGSLQYPQGQKIEGKWEHGKLATWKYRFSDGLEYSDPWNYCIFPDRRFHASIQEGLRPAGKELRTRDYVARKIPAGCYDTGDGFYNPQTKCLMSAFDHKKVLRIPTATEEKWIMTHCRKAWDEPVGYRPDLYKHWSTGRRGDVPEEPSEEEEINDDDFVDSNNGSSDISFRYSDASWAYLIE